MGVLGLGVETVVLSTEVAYWGVTTGATVAVAGSRIGAELATVAFIQSVFASYTAVQAVVSVILLLLGKIYEFLGDGVKFYTYYQYAGLRFIILRLFGVDIAEVYSSVVRITGVIMLILLIVGPIVGPWTWTYRQNETLQALDKMHCLTVPAGKVFSDSWNDAVDFYESLQPELNIFLDIVFDFASVLFDQAKLFLFDLVDIIASMFTKDSSLIGCASAAFNVAAVKQPLCIASNCVIRRLMCWVERVYQFVLFDVLAALLRPIAGTQVVSIIVYFVEGARNTLILIYHAVMIVLTPSIDAGCTNRSTSVSRTLLTILRDPYPTAYNNFVDPNRCLQTRGVSCLRFWILMTIGGNFFPPIRDLLYAFVENTLGTGFKNAIQTFFSVIETVISALTNLGSYITNIVVNFVTSALGPIADQLKNLQSAVDAINSTLSYLRRLIRRFTIEGDTGVYLTAYLARGWDARVRANLDLSSSSSSSSARRGSPFADWISDEEAEPVAIEYEVPLVIAKQLIPFIEMSGGGLHPLAQLTDDCRAILQSETGLDPRILAHLMTDEPLLGAEFARDEFWYCAVQYVRSRAFVPYNAFLSWPESHVYLGQTWLDRSEPCKNVIERDVLAYILPFGQANANASDYDPWFVSVFAPCVDRYLAAFPRGGRFDFIWPAGTAPAYASGYRAPVEYARHTVVLRTNERGLTTAYMALSRKLALVGVAWQRTLAESPFAQLDLASVQQDTASSQLSDWQPVDEARWPEYQPRAVQTANNTDHGEYWRQTSRTRCHIAHALETIGWTQGSAFGLSAGHGLGVLQHVINPDHAARLDACLARHEAPVEQQESSHDAMSRTTNTSEWNLSSRGGSGDEGSARVSSERTGMYAGRQMHAIGTRRFDWNPPVRTLGSKLFGVMRGVLRAAYLLFNRLSLTTFARGIDSFLGVLDEFDYVTVLGDLVQYLGVDLIPSIWDELACKGPKYYDARTHPNRPWTRYCLLRAKLWPIGVLYRAPAAYEDTIIPHGVPCKAPLDKCRYASPLLGSVFTTLRVPTAASVFASLLPTPVSLPCAEYEHTSAIGFTDHWDVAAYVLEEQSLEAGVDVMRQLRTGTTGAAILFGGKIVAYIAWLPLYLVGEASYAEHVIAADALKDVRYVGEVLFRFENNGVFPRSTFHEAAVGINIWLIMGPVVFLTAVVVFAFVYAFFVFKAAFDLAPALIGLVQVPPWATSLRGRLAAEVLGNAVPVQLATVPANADMVQRIAQFIGTRLPAQVASKLGGTGAMENYQRLTAIGVPVAEVNGNEPMAASTLIGDRYLHEAAVRRRGPAAHNDISLAGAQPSDTSTDKTR